MRLSHKTRLFYFSIVALLLAQVVGADEHPNFIIVMTDDQGWGDAGYVGHPRLKTPNLDAMVAGGKMPARPLDGVSLVPLLRNNAGQFDREICFATRGWLAIQNEKHKLVRPKGEESSFELYDMQNDPHETRNIAASNREISQSLRRKLDNWVAECEASQLGHDYE